MFPTECRSQKLFPSLEPQIRSTVVLLLLWCSEPNRRFTPINRPPGSWRNTSTETVGSGGGGGGVLIPFTGVSRRTSRGVTQEKVEHEEFLVFYLKYKCLTSSKIRAPPLTGLTMGVLDKQHLPSSGIAA